VTPPPTRRDESVVDVRHGEHIADPYRWLEDTTSAETRAWIEAQNDHTERLLATVAHRAEIRERLTRLWDHPRRSAPVFRGGRWFQLRNSGLQPQDVLFVLAAPDGEGSVLLDPNTFSADGTVSLADWSVSPDGAVLAYAVSEGGSDWLTWRFRDVPTGGDREDVLRWSKFSTVAWTPDAKHVFYAGYDAPAPGRELLDENRVPRLARHRLGDPPDRDEVVLSRPDQPGWSLHAGATDDDRFLVVTISRGTAPQVQLHVLDHTDPERGLVPLVADFDNEVAIVGNDGATFYLLTDHDAPRRRIVAVHLDATDRRDWRELVPETTDTLVEATVAGNRLLTHYLHHAHSRLTLLDLDGTSTTPVELPTYSSVVQLAASPEQPVAHLAVTSFTDPGSILSVDVTSGRTTTMHRSAPEHDLVTEQVFVPADGVEIPVFIVHRPGVAPTGEVPVLLYGYGGFNIPLTPAYSPARALFAEGGGLYAVANLRGGGEYGRAWHDAGRLAVKQNVFDDFCAVARWLGGPSGWSRPGRIAIHGGSNGGLLVGACLTQQPELFGAAVPVVGVFDMLRFHLFTIGWAWTSDYGDPDDPEQFGWVRAYSPLHNIRPGTRYPATLVLTGDHDDRVAPGHSFKFAATLQAAQGGDAPILIRVETAAGHGAGKPTQKAIEEGTDLLAFLDHVLRR
jgi:prolyl oligopeptidase